MCIILYSNTYPVILAMLYYTSVVFFYARTRVLFNASQYGLFEWEFNPLKPEAVNDVY